MMREHLPVSMQSEQTVVAQQVEPPRVVDTRPGDPLLAVPPGWKFKLKDLNLRDRPHCTKVVTATDIKSPEMNRKCVIWRCGDTHVIVFVVWTQFPVGTQVKWYTCSSRRCWDNADFTHFTSSPMVPHCGFDSSSTLCLSISIFGATSSFGFFSSLQLPCAPSTRLTPAVKNIKTTFLKVRPEGIGSHPRCLSVEGGFFSNVFIFLTAWREGNLQGYQWAGYSPSLDSGLHTNHLMRNEEVTDNMPPLC